MKTTNQYHFSVEGYTERWYLEWLQKKINCTPEATHTVQLINAIEKNPFKYAKRPTIIEQTEIFHLCDYESGEPVHVENFQRTIDEMKLANDSKRVKYRLGYSNFTFDLWIILHKMDCNKCLNYRWQYIDQINIAYDETFRDMDDYKREDNFKRILRSLSLQDALEAIKRAKSIMKRNEEVGYVLQNYKNYKYYKENPALMIWESIEKILKECGLT